MYMCVAFWMVGWTDGRTDGRTDGWMDGWMDGYEFTKHARPFMCVFLYAQPCSCSNRKGCLSKTRIR